MMRYRNWALSFLSLITFASATLIASAQQRAPIAPHAEASSDKAEHAASEQPVVGLAEKPHAERIWDELALGNRRFVANQPKKRDYVAARKQLADGQHPRVVIVTCSDSRVAPELLFDQNLGELFVIRLAGNVTDAVALGSIEYAVEHLHAEVLVILGHEKCGAVQAAAARQPLDSPNLTAIVERITPALDKLDKEVSAATDDEYLRLAIAANVRRSASDILRHSEILAREVEAKKLSVIAAVYSLKSGEVKRIDAEAAPGVPR